MSLEDKTLRIICNELYHAEEFLDQRNFCQFWIRIENAMREAKEARLESELEEFKNREV